MTEGNAETGNTNDENQTRDEDIKGEDSIAQEEGAENEGNIEGGEEKVAQDENDATPEPPSEGESHNESVNQDREEQNETENEDTAGKGQEASSVPSKDASEGEEKRNKNKNVDEEFSGKDDDGIQISQNKSNNKRIESTAQQIESQDKKKRETLSVAKQMKLPQAMPFFAAKKAELESEIPRLLMVEMLCREATKVANGIKRLARLCHGIDKARNQKAALQMGGHAVLIATMKRWPKVEKIQANSCVCMQNMTSNYPDAKKLFAAIGGMEAIMITMCNFAQSEQLLNFGCGALNNYFSGIDEEAKHIAHRFVRTLEGIEMLVYVMKEFPSNARLHERACRIFVSLCSFEDCKETLRAKGAISAVATSIENLVDDQDVQRWGQEFMKKIFCP